MSLESSGSLRAAAFHVVESCGKFIASGRCQPYMDKGCDFMGKGKHKKQIFGVDQIEQKEALTGRELVVADPSIEKHRQTKPKWKDSCFIKLDEEELARPKDIKSDPRPILRYHINCLFIAAGWLIGRRKRSGKYNGIGEYVYKSPGGRPIREFHRAWRMCGENLLTDAPFFPTQSHECMQWADMNELWADLSNTVEMIEENFSELVTAASMAQLWCILDPYANVVFIEKTIRLLKVGIAVKAKRTVLVASNIGSAARNKKVSRSGRSRLNPRLLQDWEGSHGCSPSSEQGEIVDDIKFSWSRRPQKKSRKVSEMELDRYGDDDSCPALVISSSKRRPKKPKLCSLRDDDLLLSALVKYKGCRATKKRTKRKLKPLKKRKTLEGSCRLLPRSFKVGGKHVMEGKWSLVESRTVLSWLIHCGVVSSSDVIQCRSIDDDVVLKDGVISRDGILCHCCNEVLSVSAFKFHAGFQLNQSCTNLFVKSGKPLVSCQLEAWSSEFGGRQVLPQIDPVDATDHNDDSCGRCGDVGELKCCDSCPSAFHLKCLFEQELPEGSWYCRRCRCQICGDLVNDTETLDLLNGLQCSQCEHKYHRACMQQKVLQIGLSSSTEWLCGDGCYEVYTGLQSRIGLKNFIGDGLVWTLLRCIHGDHNAAQSSQDAFAAECNSKLAVAITIFEECFLPMVDTRTGISMIPQVIFNLGSQFARLDYSGFYTVVLEEDDVIMSVASIRIHGTEVAELPLIATCSRNRRRGMCRRLISSIEEMLISLNIKKLVISAIPELLQTWTCGFGFEPLDEDEKQSLSAINFMVFPGSIWLKKKLVRSTDKRTGSTDDMILCKTGAGHRGYLSARDQSMDIEARHGNHLHEEQDPEPSCRFSARETNLSTRFDNGDDDEVNEDAIAFSDSDTADDGSVFEPKGIRVEGSSCNMKYLLH